MWNYYCRFSIISSQNGWIDLVWVLYNWRKWSVPKLRFWKMAHPCPLLHLFLVFSNGSFLQQNDQDMNTRRLDCQSLPRNHTTRAPSKSSFLVTYKCCRRWTFHWICFWSRLKTFESTLNGARLIFMVILSHKTSSLSKNGNANFFRHQKFFFLLFDFKNVLQRRN